MIDCRALQPEDAPAIRVLYEALVQDSFDGFPPEARLRYLKDWQEADLSSYSANPAYVMAGAFQESKALGLLLGSAPEGGVGTVIWLGVAETARNQGLGAQLMQWAAKAYRERGCHKLKLFTHTEAARRFYERLGMQIEGWHPHHWWGVSYWSLAWMLETDINSKG